jgi:hypothetical protein
MQHLLRDACARGDLQQVKQMHDEGAVDIHACDDAAFRTACGCGHLKVAKWLFSLGGVNVHVHDDWAFRYACSNRHLLVAEWLLSLGGVQHDRAFLTACEKGHCDVAQWLYGLGGVDIHACGDHAARFAPFINRFLARWLISLDPGWAWPAESVRALRVWCAPRDAWMRSVIQRTPVGS